MHVTKIRITDESGLVPAGAYFARLAKDLSAAAATEKAEERKRKVEARYRCAAAPLRSRATYNHHAMV